METKEITFEELQALAKENYCHGGMDIVECWDEGTFNTYVEMFGPMTYKRAMNMMGFLEEIDREEEAMSHWV